MFQILSISRSIVFSLLVNLDVNLCKNVNVNFKEGRAAHWHCRPPPKMFWIIMFDKQFMFVKNPQTHSEYSSKDILYPYSSFKPIQNILKNLNGSHKVRPGRSLPLLLLSLLHLWSGKSFLGSHPKNDYQVNLSCAKESWYMRLYGKDEKVIFFYRRKKIVSTAIVGQV